MLPDNDVPERERYTVSLVPEGWPTDVPTDELLRLACYLCAKPSFATRRDVARLIADALLPHICVPCQYVLDGPWALSATRAGAA